MRYYFKRFFVLHSLEVIFSFLIKKSRQKAIEIETAIFHPLGNPKGRTLDHFFDASHICHKFPYKLSFRSEASTYGLTCSGDGITIELGILFFTKNAAYLQEYPRVFRLQFEWIKSCSQ